MKKINLLLISALLLGYSVKAQKQQKHVILVTIDGFRPDFYLEKDWNTPTLHAMAQKGVHAYGVNSVFPSVTYPSHTTIVTGVQPAEHGIYFNNLPLPDSIYWKYDQVKVPTIWSTAKANGMVAASLMWPASAGVPNDFNLSDVGSKGFLAMRDNASPKNVYDTVLQEVFPGEKEFKLGHDQNVAKIAAWVIRNKRPNVMTVHLFSVDHAEHETGRNGTMVHEAISDADSSVAIIKEAIRSAGMADNTLLIVTGDHGFYDVERTLQPNTLLAKAGLLDAKDLYASRAFFHAVGGSAFLFVKNKDPKTIEAVRTIFKNLPEQDRRYFKIIDERKMQTIGADPEAVFALSGLENSSFGNKQSGAFITAGHGGTHGYFPDSRNIQTGFLMIGPGVKQGYEIKEMNLRDITAIMANYLGIDMPTIKGTSPKGIFVK